MKLMTNIPPRRDDTVIADFGDVSYLFERDEFGDLVGDVTSGVHVDVLLQTGNFFLVDPAPAAAQFVPVGQVPSGEQNPSGEVEGGEADPNGGDASGEQAPLSVMTVAPEEMTADQIRAEIEARTGEAPKARASKSELVEILTALRAG